jgi:hypothetical protein
VIYVKIVQSSKKGIKMRYFSVYLGKCIITDKLRNAIFFFVLLILLTLLLSNTGCIFDKSPPDLRNCTYIEIRYPRSTLDYFLPGPLKNVLNKEEKKYVKSFEYFKIADKKKIKSFAMDVSLGKYNGHMRGMLSYANPVQVTCYNNNKKIITFTIYRNKIITENKLIFKYPTGFPRMELIEPNEMRTLKLRGHCAWVLKSLYTNGFRLKNARSYPEPNQWCNNIVETLQNEFVIDENGIKRRQYNDESIPLFFTCPSLRKRVFGETPFEGFDDKNLPTEAVKTLFECDYAMNPNCEPNSPGDMVLLFETRAGWNQHGRPELFTFDNHEPKGNAPIGLPSPQRSSGGGCVLLNNGTVKFIRTEEELQKLRWKLAP